MSAIWNLTRSMADVEPQGLPTYEAVTCIRCTMSFNVEDYPYGQAGHKPERMRCPECLGRFFCVSGDNTARVSVEPDNVNTIPQGVE